uniref:MYND-type domain-containing protein n=2 Tax=gambiae species complex TaxID=44542 RepID=A0A6E8W6E5_ANOCL|nr:uncharacterized protein LOC120951335 [Anopheles coluzzii]
MASKQMFPPVGCSACSVQGANFQCFTCGTYYCGVSCQMNHWPMHKDFCIPRLVTATPLLGNSALLTQYPPPSITKPSNVVSKQEETVASAGDVSNIPSNVVRQQEKIPEPVMNVVATPRISTDVQQPRNGNVPATTVANEVAMTKSLSNMQIQKENQPPAAGPISNGEKLMSKLMNNPLAALKANQAAQPVANGAIPKATNNPFVTQKGGSPPVETVAQEEKSVPKTLKNPLQALKTSQPAGSAAIEKPVLKTVVPPRTQLLQHGVFPEPGRSVKISYVANDRLFVYDCGPGPNGEPNSFQSLIVRSLQCAMTVQDFLSAPPTVEDIVFAPFEDDFYRSVVKSVQDGIAEVFFPDFGNWLKVEWKKLKEIPDPKIKYAHTVTHPVWIDNVKSITPRMKEFLVTMVDLHEFVLTTVIDIPNTHIKMVDMRHSLQQYVLSEKLLAMQDPAASSNIQKKMASQLRPPAANPVPKLVVTNPTTYKPVTIMELVETNICESKGAELMITHALHAFNENKISVITKSNYTAFEKMMKECQMYGQIDPNPYNPQEQEICIVKVKDIWHRAAAVDFKDGKAVQFYLLDLPAFTDEDIDAPVRRYPPGLTRHLFAVESIVENPEFLLQAINGDESNVDMLPGMAIRADVHHTNDEEIGDTIHLNVVAFEK